MLLEVRYSSIEWIYKRKVRLFLSERNRQSIHTLIETNKYLLCYFINFDYSLFMLILTLVYRYILLVVFGWCQFELQLWFLFYIVRCIIDLRIINFYLMLYHILMIWNVIEILLSPMDFISLLCTQYTYIVIYKT